MDESPGPLLRGQSRGVPSAPVCGAKRRVPLGKLDDAAEDADVGRAVRRERHGGVVVVVAEAGAGEAAVDGLASAEVQRGEVPRVEVVVARRLRVRVDQPVAERQLRDHRGRALLARPDGLAAVGRGRGALLALLVLVMRLMGWLRGLQRAVLALRLVPLLLALG